MPPQGGTGAPASSCRARLALDQVQAVRIKPAAENVIQSSNAGGYAVVFRFRMRLVHTLPMFIATQAIALDEINFLLPMLIGTQGRGLSQKPNKG